MPLEQLIVIAFLILLPLLEALMRRRRARTNRDVDEDLVDEELIEIEDQAEMPSLPSTPPPLPPSHHVPAAPLVTREGRARNQKPAVPIVREASRRSHERAGRERVRRWIGPARDLRRAIVLTTILGPCRALDKTSVRRQDVTISTFRWRPSPGCYSVPWKALTKAVAVTSVASVVLLVGASLAAQPIRSRAGAPPTRVIGNAMTLDEQARPESDARDLERMDSDMG